VGLIYSNKQGKYFCFRKNQRSGKVNLKDGTTTVLSFFKSFEIHWQLVKQKKQSIALNLRNCGMFMKFKK
jgi:hypothetical protein